jgi:uncharacterized protein (TIGR00251 family)
MTMVLRPQRSAAVGATIDGLKYQNVQYAGARGVEFRQSGDAVEFFVKVVPGASRTKIAGVLGEALKVSVAAPPEKGKANDAVIELLADRLGVSRKDVAVAAGATNPRKTIRVVGVTAEECRERLM